MQCHFISIRHCFDSRSPKSANTPRQNTNRHCYKCGHKLIPTSRVFRFAYLPSLHHVSTIHIHMLHHNVLRALYLAGLCECCRGGCGGLKPLKPPTDTSLILPTSSRPTPSGSSQQGTLGDNQPWMDGYIPCDTSQYVLY